MLNIGTKMTVENITTGEALERLNANIIYCLNNDKKIPYSIMFAREHILDTIKDVGKCAL